VGYRRDICWYLVGRSEREREKKTRLEKLILEEKIILKWIYKL
jgi:hypothetical protein